MSFYSSGFVQHFYVMMKSYLHAFFKVVFLVVVYKLVDLYPLQNNGFGDASGIMKIVLSVDPPK